MQCSTTCHTTNASKVERIGLQSFALSTIFIWHLANWLPLLQAPQHLFFQGKCFHNQQEAENAFQEFVESQGMDFYATWINKLISHWQKCVDCNGLYLINKDVFKPNYNDWKFTVWNCNFICTNSVKSEDITLPIKVHIVKDIVFPVVMYGCECWTINKAECQRIDAFRLWYWRRLLRILWTTRRSSQSILKGIKTKYSLEGMMLKPKL